jgi:hypothetical protein
VVQIQDEETVSVCVVTDNPHGWSSWSSVWPFVRCIDTDRDTVVVGGRVAIRGGHCFIHVSGFESQRLCQFRRTELTEHGRMLDHMTADF